MLEVAWCSVSRRWEALVFEDERTVGYGQGWTRAQAVERAMQDALRHGYSVPLIGSYLAWGAAVVQDVRDYILGVIAELARR